MERKFTETKDYSFLQLCNQYHKFVVPTFQRAYSWRNKQINDFWEDLLSNDNYYFIGNLVCLDPSKESEDRLVIIDGQQRLLTISLLLLVLRNAYENLLESAKKSDDKKVFNNAIARINKQLLYEEEDPPFERFPVLMPGKSNLAKVYEGLLDGEVDVDDKAYVRELDGNQVKYIKNYLILRKLVKSHLKQVGNPVVALKEISEKTTTLTFIAIICKSDNDAYKIFEGLNATGVGLSVADLVKNAVMQAVKETKFKSEIEGLWEELEGIFEQSDVSLFPRFLRHQWISKEGYITTSKLFDSIKKDKLRGKNSSAIVRYVEELSHDAKAYIGFRFDDADHYLKRKKLGNALESIKNFRLLGVEQAYEVILALYNRLLRDEDYKPSKFRTDLEDIWTFSLRAILMNINTSEYERIFADHCKDVAKKNTSSMSTISKNFKLKLAKIVSNDSAFIEGFAGELRYRTDNRLIVHVLDKLLRHFNAAVKVAEPTIEHILPKNPTEWGLKTEDIAPFVHNIGNLTLLYDKDNSELGNAAMKVKVAKVFSKSAFRLNKKLASVAKHFEEDPEEAIEQRGQELAKVAAKIWKL